jgi:hypothetical protein
LVRVVHYSIDRDLEIPRPRDGGTYTMAAEWRRVMLQPKVVQVATAFCENRRSELAELLPGIELVLNETHAPRVLVLAENLELALFLALQLPDWSFLVGPEVPLDCLPREQVRRIHELPSPSRTGPVHAVATADALGVGDFSQFVALIRADGGVEIPRCTASIELRIGGQMPVDDAGDVELLEQRLDQRQRTQIEGLLGVRATVPGERHSSASMRKVRNILASTRA